MVDTPLFEVTTPAATAAARRLTTATKVQAALGIGSAGTSAIETLIDGVSADCAGFCGLAAPANGATPPTFGQEVVKATWLDADHDRGTKLLLPWRVAISAIGQVVEDGENLTFNVDYRLIGGAMLERMSDGVPVCWSRGGIVVPYTAGWLLPDGVPADLEMRVIDQVKMAYLQNPENPAVRSRTTERVGSETLAVPGGDSIGKSGLLLPLESLLERRFKNWARA